MTAIIKDLMHEHDAILSALNILEKIISEIGHGAKVDTEDLKKMVEFIKLFADKCHHGKEEDMLFPALVNTGLAKNQGPIAVMLHEHTLGRNYVAGMSAALENDFDKNSFCMHASEYIRLLRQHISKENLVLFPMSEQRLEQSTLDELKVRFDAFEETVMGHEKHNELHQILTELKNKYN